jgi:redox-sensitive bicupin YhaK (pirin superfamily)
MVAKVPCYSTQFLYHIHLEGGKQFSIITDSEFEYAVFLIAGNAVINDNEFQAGDLIVFGSPGELIEINNYSRNGVDIILFGGGAYNEPIAIDETFVMNNPHEITQAYNDYYDGKYGEISFDKIKDK